MACSEENGKSELENATDTTASSQPPLYQSHPPNPHPLPLPSHSQWPPPNYPSDPPPEYSTIVGSKPYDASKATGPYLYTTNEASQPHQIILPSNVQARNGRSQHVVYMDRNAMMRSDHLGMRSDHMGMRSDPLVMRSDHLVMRRDHLDMRSDHLGQPSFLGLIILSCCVFWFFGGWICGGIAFFVALVAQSSAASGDVAGARRLGHLSLCLSICGLVFGIVVTIVVIEGVTERRP